MKKETIVSVKDMCLAREKRVSRQNKLLSRYKLPLISFTLNIPGNIKDKKLYRKIFIEGIISAKNFLDNNRIKLINLEYYYEITGPEGYFVIDFNSKSVKKIMLEIEENHTLGRIFDFDVVNQDGTKLSRLDFAIERKCFICKNPAKFCTRNQSHEIREILCKIEELSNVFFNSQNILPK